jgi:predicted permease
MELFGHDVLHAVRALIKHRGYSAFAILTLGLGIGANVGMFSVFGWLLSPALPVPRSSELVELTERSTSNQPAWKGLSWRAYLDYVNARLSALPELAAYDPHLTAGIGRDNETVTARVTAVTGNYFSLLQVRAFRGRVINEQDDSPNGADVVVLSHRCWRDLFGGRDEVLGTELRVNETTYTIIGVAPATFTGVDPQISPDIWIPLSSASRSNPTLRLMMSDATSTPVGVFGRLSQGASILQAQEQLKTVAGQLGSGKSQMIGWRNIGKRTIPNYREKPWPSIVLMDNAREEAVHNTSLLVFAIAGSVLVLVAGNLTSILLARTERQSRDFAIRIALGASKWRIFRGILIESFLVSVLGTVVGLIFAFFFIRLVIGLSPEDVRWHQTIATGVFNGRVLAFGFGIAALVAGVFSLAPMVRTAFINPKLAMQMSASTGTSGRTSATFRSLLAILQTATSVVLLAFTLLLIRSAWNRSRVEFTYDAQRVSTILWKFPGEPRNSEAETSFLNAFIERLKNLPGVQAAGLCYPCKLGARFDYQDWYDSAAITPDYFRVVNAPIFRGRNFTDLDGSEGPLVGIVNQQMAQKFWPGEDPIGKRLEHVGLGNITVEIVGVVADTRKQRADEHEDPILYRPLSQANIDTTVSMRAAPSPVIRTDRRSLSLSEIRTAAKEINANVTIAEVLTVADDVERVTQVLRLAAWVLAAFAMISITLTGVGLYGLLSYIASAQTREVGVRLALGAPRISVLQLMLKRGMMLALVGVTIGLITETACSNIYSSALYSVGMWIPLYGVGMHDIPTLGFVAFIVFCFAIAASWIPSWRASRLNPIEALREE